MQQYNLRPIARLLVIFVYMSAAYFPTGPITTPIASAHNETQEAEAVKVTTPSLSASSFVALNPVQPNTAFQPTALSLRF